jgi:hypothetical protein
LKNLIFCQSNSVKRNEFGGIVSVVRVAASLPRRPGPPLIHSATRIGNHHNAPWEGRTTPRAARWHSYDRAPTVPPARLPQWSCPPSLPSFAFTTKPGSPSPTPSAIKGLTIPLARRRLLTVYICIKLQLDLQADKSSVVVKGPFFPQV